MDDRIKITILFIFLFAAMAISHWQDWSPGDDVRLWGWLIERQDENFLFPMLYYVSMPVYEVIGDAAFWLLPLIFMFGGFFILTELFREFKLPQEVILLCFATTLFSINFLSYFMKDSLMFFFACIFAYFFFRIRYKNVFCWWKMLMLVPVMMMTREIGVLFAFFFVFLVLSKIPNRLLLATAVFPTSARWTDNLINLIKEGWGNLITFHWQAFQLPNPVYWISIIGVIFTRDLFHFILVVVTVVSAFAIGAGHWECCIFRYTYSLMPLHIFYLGIAVQKYKWLYFPLVLGAAAGVLKLVVTIIGGI